MLYKPNRPYERNLLTADNATPVIGPVVSSERITSRNGPRKTLTSKSLMSEKKIIRTDDF